MGRKKRGDRKMKKPNITYIDMDGVIADFFGGLAKEFNVNSDTLKGNIQKVGRKKIPIKYGDVYEKRKAVKEKIKELLIKKQIENLACLNLQKLLGVQQKQLQQFLVG